MADIGLDVSPAGAVGLVTAADVARWLPPRAPDAHKWRAAVVLAAGSPGMTGAAHLAAPGRPAGRGRHGAGGLPGSRRPRPAHRGRGHRRPAAGWDAGGHRQLDRAGALVVGPGLGRRRRRRGRRPPPGGNGPGAAWWSTATASRPWRDQVAEVIARRRDPASVVLTPHDGEFARLAGHPPGADRIAAARDLAARLGAIVLLKGPTTVVATPDGRVRLSAAGDQRLATAGTGDVLSGLDRRAAGPRRGAARGAAAGPVMHGPAALEGRARASSPPTSSPMLPGASAPGRDR